MASASRVTVGIANRRPGGATQYSDPSRRAASSLSDGPGARARAARHPYARDPQRPPIMLLVPWSRPSVLAWRWTPLLHFVFVRHYTVRVWLTLRYGQRALT